MWILAQFFLRVLVSFHSAYGSPFPKVLDAYFTENEFSDCLSSAIAEDVKNGKQLREYLSKIEARREKLASQKATNKDCAQIIKGVCGLGGISLSENLTQLLLPIGCKINDMINKNLWYHSAALVSCEDHQSKNVPLMWRLNYFQTRTNNEKRNLNSLDITQELELEQRAIGTPDEHRKCVVDKAEPLIRWLLGQKMGSVTHWELFQKARSLYGDSFTAIGVIGEIFDEERMHCSSRKRACVLNNKLRPLYSSTEASDPVGYNYHFWSHLSMVLREGAVSQSIANYLLEWQKDSDTGDYSANRLGIESSMKTIGKAKILTAPLNRWTGIANKECNL